MAFLFLKIEETLKKSYYLSSPTLPSSYWKCTLVADPNLSKMNAYYFLQPDSSNPKIILIPQWT